MSVQTKAVASTSKNHRSRTGDAFCGLEALEERTLMSVASPLPTMTVVQPATGSASPSSDSGVTSQFGTDDGSGGPDVLKTAVSSAARFYPAPPSGLRAATASQTQIRLTWISNSGGNENGFYLDQATDSKFSQNLTTAMVGSGVTTYTAVGLSAGTTYYFRVCAQGSGWGSAHSAPVSGVTLKNIPATPAGAKATTVSKTQINVAWTSASSAYETGFYIDRATDNAFTKKLVTGSVGSKVTAFSATGLAASTTYYFRVRAYTNGGSSANCLARAVIPVVPTGLRVTAAAKSQVNLAWRFNGTGQDGFDIDRATNSDFTQGLVTYSVGKVTTATATALDSNTKYYFRVRARVAGGSSPNSVTATATSLKNAPVAPSALVVIASTCTQIDLAWMRSSASCQEGFYVDRATDSGFTKNRVTTTLGASAANYNSTGLIANTQYYFRVRAYTNGGASANCASASATTRKRVVTIAAGQDLRTAIANAQSGDVLQLSAGTYLVDPSTAGGGPLVPPDNVTIQGAGTSTIIKVKDNVGDFLTLFGGWTKGGYMVTVNGFALRNLNVDLNPAGYGGDPARDYPVGLNPNAMASAILLSQFNGLEVAGVDFTYGGINCINLSGFTSLAQNAIVTGSTFRYVPVGAGKYDHSGLYFECLNQFAINNVFTGQPSAAIAAGSALELHGGPGAAIGNQITGIFTGINICASYSVYSPGSPSGNILVESNTMTDVNLGIEFWSDPIVPLRNVMVTNNVIHVGNNDWSGLWSTIGTQWSAGIAMQPDQTGAFDGITVTKNLIDFQNETQPVCVFLTSGIILYTHSGLVTNCIAADNTVLNLPPSAV